MVGGVCLFSTVSHGGRYVCVPFKYLFLWLGVLDDVYNDSQAICILLFQIYSSRLNCRGSQNVISKLLEFYLQPAGTFAQFLRLFGFFFGGNFLRFRIEKRVEKSASRL